MQRLSDAALAAGSDVNLVGVSARGAPTGKLARAGIGTADVLSSGSTGALSLAVPGQLDQTEAATIAAQPMSPPPCGHAGRRGADGD